MRQKKPSAKNMKRCAGCSRQSAREDRIKQKEMSAICWEMSGNGNPTKTDWDSGVQTEHFHLLSVDSCEFKLLQGQGSHPRSPGIPYAHNLPAACARALRSDPKL